MAGQLGPGKSGRGGESKGGGNRRISAAMKQRAVLELRKQGITFEVIAEEVGYSSASGAHKAFQTAMKKTIQEPADDLRKLVRERLNTLLASAWPKALMGSPRHIEMCLKIMDREAALLGLDAPKQVEDHRIVSMQVMADEIAQETGLDPDELIAEAERIIKQAAGGG